MKYKGTISNIYEQLRKGDVSAIIDLLTEDVEWTTSENPPATPLAGTRHGKAQVREFLNRPENSNRQPISQPHLLIEEGKCVVALGKAEVLNASTGETVMHDWVHAWFLNNDGKVERFHSYLDSAREALPDTPMPSAR